MKAIPFRTSKETEAIFILANGSQLVGWFVGWVVGWLVGWVGSNGFPFDVKGDMYGTLMARGEVGEQYSLLKLHFCHG